MCTLTGGIGGSMTIAEIARKAGVSIGTVDRVLHNRGHVAEQTRQKIQSVIDESNYKPNHFAQQLKKGDSFKIGILIPYLDSGAGYWKLVHSGFLEGIQSIYPFNMELEFRYFDRSIPGDLYEKGLDLLQVSDIKAMILAPLVFDDVVKLLSVITVPYVFIDSPMPIGFPQSVIIQNPYRGGQTAAHIMKLIRNTGTFAVMRMYKSAYNLQERARGFQDYFKSDSQIKVIDAVCPYQNAKSVFSFLEELFSLHPDISGIFVTQTETFIVSQFLSYTGRKTQVTLIGYDLQAENRLGLEDGSIDCIISQRPEIQGITSIRELHRVLALGQEWRGKIQIPIDILLPENFSEYNLMWS